MALQLSNRGRERRPWVDIVAARCRYRVLTGRTGWRRSLTGDVGTSGETRDMQE